MWLCNATAQLSTGSMTERVNYAQHPDDKYCEYTQLELESDTESDEGVDDNDANSESSSNTTEHFYIEKEWKFQATWKLRLILRL